VRGKGKKREGGKGREREEREEKGGRSGKGREGEKSTSPFQIPGSAADFNHLYSSMLEFINKQFIENVHGNLFLQRH